MLTVDERCTMPSCANGDIYRMVGHCTNCNTQFVRLCESCARAAKQWVSEKASEVRR